MDLENKDQQTGTNQIEMANRLLPDWDTIKNFHNPLTEGESKIITILDELLPANWMIFAQPYLNGSRPDVVILNPRLGMTIIEVKDWDLKSYCWRNNGLCVITGNGYKNINSPVEQVKHYKDKIYDLLVPSLGKAAAKNSKAFGFIKTAIYFHRMTGKDARDFFSKSRGSEYTSIVGYDDLEKSQINKLTRQSDAVLLGKWQDSWVDEMIFWLNPPFHSIEQTRSLELSSEQKEHAEPKSGHFRLRGVAGSGKTVIIANRAAKLASEGFRVLIITYNITLWHFIRDMVARTPYKFSWKNIDFMHFHGFCNDVLSELGYPKPSENYLDNIVLAVEKALESAIKHKRNLDQLKYDAILIDEGQDFQWEWYNLLSKFLTERDELLFVCDKRQNIYATDLNWIDGGMRNVKFRGRWRELKTIYRFPKKIGDAANRFSDIFGLDMSVEVENYEQTTLFDQPLNPHVVWRNINCGEYLLQILYAYGKIRSVQQKAREGHPSDIVILVPTTAHGENAVKYFGRQGIESNHVFGGNNLNKKAFWLGDSRLKICTYHSFKGWEARHVILLIPKQWDYDLDSLVYTAITRTRENIIILNCNDKYKDFGKEYPANWID
jgi:hypothetical protein